MDTALQRMWAYFWLPEMKYVIAAFVLLALLSVRLLPRERKRTSHTVAVFVLCLLGQLLGAVLEALDYSRLAVMVHEVFLIGTGMVVFRLVSTFFFRLILPRMGISVARIAEDIFVLFVYAVFIIARLHIVGLDPSSLLTTSAVITAVLALAMQDTLGNVLSGVALQLDNSLHTGDWIRIDDVTGRVAQVRWRQTTIRTRNGEIVVVPNSQLMRGRFTVYGRADISNWPWRRWVWFNVTYDSPPALVIEKVEKAISAAAIANVASDPAPTCVLMEFGQGYGRYALRYWMLDPQPDDPTDSTVRVHILAALHRAGMALAVPEQSMRVVKENDAYWKSARRREIEKRMTGLRNLDLFAGMQDDELRTLSERAVYAPYAAGDVIFHQGDPPHWLYLVTAGEAEVWMDFPGHPRQLFRTIQPGETFGEKGVLTGEARRATILARTDMVCYRVDQETLEAIIRSRPELAEVVAGILARREVEMEKFMRQFSDAPAEGSEGQRKAGVLALIKDFLGL